MKREVFVLNLAPDMKDEYKRRHDELWPEVGDLLLRKGIKNYSIWNIENFLFGYMEVHGDYVMTEKDKEIEARWNEYMKDCISFFASSEAGTMSLMYHDIGIVREDKTNIGHRVFVTHLKPGMHEEYKRRHDVLVEERGDKITEGPTSNFTIWNAGDYIFGYCENDTTMEQPMTEEEKQEKIKWETWQLEIMDWVTDDCDWIFGTKHPKIELMFKFN